MKVKSYRRKGKGMTGGQFKRMEWKRKMAARSASHGDKCFKCGESGHWANKCPGKMKNYLKNLKFHKYCNFFYQNACEVNF